MAYAESLINAKIEFSGSTLDPIQRFFTTQTSSRPLSSISP